VTVWHARSARLHRLRLGRCAWAKRSGRPTIDVTSAFRAGPVGLPALLMDDLHPNAAGSRVWAAAVADAMS